MSAYQIEQRGQRVILPPTQHTDTTVEFSSWNEAADRLERHVRSQLPKRRTEPGSRIKVGLVHRSDNNYNANAISVVIPEDAGNRASLDGRHLGFLLDRFLRQVGESNLPDLIAYAGGEVECSLVVHSEVDVELDLPPGRVLGKAIRGFLDSRGVDGGIEQRRAVVREFRTHAGRSAETSRTLSLLRTFGSAQTEVRSVDIAMAGIDRFRERTLQLTEGGTGRQLGEVADGVLYLLDERDRECVLPLLAAEQVPVAQPVTYTRVGEDGTWPADETPNAVAHWRPEGTDLRAKDARDWGTQQTFAIYNPTLRTLWVEDSRLVAAALRFTSRLGLAVDEVGTPKRSWALNLEVEYDALRDPSLRSQVNDLWGPKKLLPAHRAKVGGVLRPIVTWEAVVAPDAGAATADAGFLLHQRFVAARTALFPEHDLLGSAAACRLCGCAAAEFTTPITAATLAYCFACLTEAVRGYAKDPAAAAEAVRALSDLEFDGQPFLEEQLGTLHFNPAERAPARLIDEALLLRFAIYRGAFPWTHLLVDSGVAEAGVRTSRGTVIRARDGHLCHSLREKAVCDFLHQHGIAHTREPLYPADADYNPHGKRRADWELDDGTFVELWGMPNDPVYAAKMVEKRELAARYDVRLVELVDKDLPAMPRIFEEWIPAGLRSAWAWSPLLVVSERTQAANLEKKPTEGNDGYNAFNVASRDERVERCRLAVALQGEGLSRAQIGERLGAGPDAVKMMLRDGKFYADPDSDPERSALASRAVAARNAMQTRAQFQLDAGLTAPKAHEAWRDAGILASA